MFRRFVVIFALCFIKDALSAPVKKAVSTDRCSDAMDIAFILDASTDDYVTPNVWEAMLNLTMKIVDTFGASEEGDHYAVMTFSNKPHIVMNFNTYEGTDLNSENINGVIGVLERQVNYTFIERALDAAKTQLFTSDAGMRQNARKVAFVVTDGIQTNGDEGPSASLAAASEGLQSKGVEVYAIGVGSDMNVFALLDIATSEDHVFSGRYITTEPGFAEFKQSFCESA